MALQSGDRTTELQHLGQGRLRYSMCYLVVPLISSILFMIAGKESFQYLYDRQ